MKPKGFNALKGLTIDEVLTIDGEVTLINREKGIFFSVKIAYTDEQEPFIECKKNKIAKIKLPPKHLPKHPFPWPPEKP